MNASETLTPERASALTSLWTEAFADISDAALECAFRKTISGCKFWPKVADVREHVEQAKSAATEQAAEIAWQGVLDLRRVYWSPDTPGGFSRGMPKLSERVQQACRASGVFREHDSVESLHTWAKKCFVESFIAWRESEQDKFLLPDGEIKSLLAGAAQRKALPAPKDNWDELRARSLAHAEELKANPPQQPDLQRAIRQLTFKPSVHSLDEQKRILREKGFLPKEEYAEARV